MSDQIIMRDRIIDYYARCVQIGALSFEQALRDVLTFEQALLAHAEHQTYVAETYRKLAEDALNIAPPKPLVICAHCAKELTI